MLHASDKFEAEIVARLEREGCPEPAIAYALAWVREKRLVDDARLSHESVAKLLSSGAGPDVARQKLLSRGAPESVLEDALAEGDDDRQIEGIRTLLGKKLRPLSTRAQMARALASRGFEERLIEPELDRVFGELSEPRMVGDTEDTI